MPHTFIPQRYAKRESGIELLRILSMLVIIFCHAPYSSITHEHATLQSVQAHFPSFCYITGESVTVALCVDIFVFITGFFGIRFNWRGVFNILFIKYFWGLAIGLCAIAVLHQGVSLKYFVDVLNPFGSDWFISAYLGLFVLAIFFNSFIDTCTRPQFKRVLALYLGMIFIFGWLTPFYSEVFPLRHSSIEFGGLYLLGRYCHKYGIGGSMSKTRIFALWLAVMAVNVGWYIVSRLLVSSESLISYLGGLHGSYSSPFAFFGAMLMVVLFSRFKFRAPFINWLAISAIAMYVIHINPIVHPYFEQACRSFLSQAPAAVEPLCNALFAIVFYLVCTPFDQIRIWLWDRLDRGAFRHKTAETSGSLNK